MTLRSMFMFRVFFTHTMCVVLLVTRVSTSKFPPNRWTNCKKGFIIKFNRSSTRDFKN